MSVTITPDVATGLADITRPNFAINQTVSASATGAGSDVANVTNVTAVVVGTQPDLVITPGTTSVSIGGSIQDPFNDQFTYVEKGTIFCVSPRSAINTRHSACLMSSRHNTENGQLEEFAKHFLQSFWSISF